MLIGFKLHCRIINFEGNHLLIALRKFFVFVFAFHVVVTDNQDSRTHSPCRRNSKLPAALHDVFLEGLLSELKDDTYV